MPDLRRVPQRRAGARAAIPLEMAGRALAALPRREAAIRRARAAARQPTDPRLPEERRPPTDRRTVRTAMRRTDQWTRVPVAEAELAEPAAGLPAAEAERAARARAAEAAPAARAAPPVTAAYSRRRPESSRAGVVRARSPERRRTCAARAVSLRRASRRSPAVFSSGPPSRATMPPIARAVTFAAVLPSEWRAAPRRARASSSAARTTNASPASAGLSRNRPLTALASNVDGSLGGLLRVGGRHHLLALRHTRGA
jgi:hypothetical protein